jgi:hypothetical protein
LHLSGSLGLELDFWAFFFVWFFTFLCGHVLVLIGFMEQCLMVVLVSGFHWFNFFILGSILGGRGLATAWPSVFLLGRKVLFYLRNLQCCWHLLSKR